MATRRSVSILSLAALLPVLANAADQAMLQLIMPDARVVLEINLDRLATSPIGQAMSPQLKAALSSMRPAVQDPQDGVGALDMSQFAQEVIFAGAPPSAPGKQAPSLIIVHGLLDPAWIESFGALNGAKSSYLGVPILSSGNGNAIAFLEGSISIIGRNDDVKAAIRRRGQNAPPSPVLAEGLERYEGQCDAWMVAQGSLAAPKSPGAGFLKWLDHADAFTGGVRFSPDFELSAHIVMHDEKDVAQMTDSLRWFAGVVQAQEKSALNLDDMQFQIDGKRISLSLEVPEKQIRAAIQERQVGNAARAARGAAIRPPEVTNGLPEPPSGTIRVQSSPADMGTVLLSVGKNQ